MADKLPVPRVEVYFGGVDWYVGIGRGARLWFHSKPYRRRHNAIKAGRTWATICSLTLFIDGKVAI